MLFRLKIKLFTSLLILTLSNKSAYSMPQSEELALESFGSVFNKIKSFYIENPDENLMAENAIRGMLAGLDPHSSYLSPKEFSAVKTQTKGEFGGLGIEITMSKNFPMIISPIDDSPADKAGLHPGDIILAADGESLEGLSIERTVDKLKGNPGSSVKLLISRNESNDTQEIEITRALIKVNPIKVKLDRDIVYLRISAFTEQTSGHLITKLNEIINQTKELSGAIIDLRNNAGGLLNQAISVAEIFLNKGEIVSTKGRRPKDSKIYRAEKKDILKGRPLVILINEGTASASEIVAGALQDHGRAIIVGSKSFGKGSVQTIFPLDDGGAMKITTALYYTPSGRSIQASGIVPDLEIPKTKNNQDTLAIMESDLPNHLPNNQNSGLRFTENKSETEDYQYAKAIEVVRIIRLLNATKN